MKRPDARDEAVVSFAEHLRLVHFTIVVVTGVLWVSVRAPMNRISDELNQLRKLHVPGFEAIAKAFRDENNIREDQPQILTFQPTTSASIAVVLPCRLGVCLSSTDPTGRVWLSSELSPPESTSSSTEVAFASELTVSEFVQRWETWRNLRVFAPDRILAITILYDIASDHDVGSAGWQPAGKSGSYSHRNITLLNRERKQDSHVPSIADPQSVRIDIFDNASGGLPNNPYVTRSTCSFQFDANTSIGRVMMKLDVAGRELTEQAQEECGSLLKAEISGALATATSEAGVDVRLLYASLMAEVAYKMSAWKASGRLLQGFGEGEFHERFPALGCAIDSQLHRVRVDTDPAVFVQTRGDELSIEGLGRAEMARESAEAEQAVVDVWSIKLRGRDVIVYGNMILLLVISYFVFHLWAFARVVRGFEVGHHVPWIGVYDGLLAKLLYLSTAAAWPFACVFRSIILEPARAEKLLLSAILFATGVLGVVMFIADRRLMQSMHRGVP